jgi:hypothetical protein
MSVSHDLAGGAPTVGTTSSAGIAPKTGWALTLVVAVAMLANGLFSLLGPKLAPEAVAPNLQAGGFTMDQSYGLGVIMLVCAIAYVIPRTALLGAILMTGFVGGAMATEYRIGLILSGSQLVNVTLGVLTWTGLLLRERRIRELLPLMS